MELAATLGARKLEAEKFLIDMIALREKLTQQALSVRNEIPSVRRALVAAIENRFFAIERDLGTQIVEFEKSAGIEINQAQLAVAKLTQFTELTQGLLFLGTVPEIAGSRAMVGSLFVIFYFYFYFFFYNYFSSDLFSFFCSDSLKTARKPSKNSNCYPSSHGSPFSTSPPKMWRTSDSPLSTWTVFR